MCINGENCPVREHREAARRERVQRIVQETLTADPLDRLHEEVNRLSFLVSRLVSLRDIGG